MRVTGVILAGGRGARMQGADKGLIHHAGKPLIEWAIACLRPQVEELLINANRNVDVYARYDLKVVPDLRDDFAGPLAGLEAAMAQASHDWVLMVPCDCPALPADLRGRLQAAIISSAAQIAVAQTPDGLQPTVALIHRSTAGSLRDFLASGQRRAKDWILRHSPVPVAFDDPAFFANLNTVEALSAASDPPARLPTSSGR